MSIRKKIRALRIALHRRTNTAKAINDLTAIVGTEKAPEFIATLGDFAKMGLTATQITRVARAIDQMSIFTVVGGETHEFGRADLKYFWGLKQ